MTKNDLIRQVQVTLRDYPLRDVSYAVNVIFEAMKMALKRNERIEIRGLGNFTVRNRKFRWGRNPKTGKTVQIPPRKVAFFKVGKELREMVQHGP
ncbi:MAG: HU family DNA-binding protein [Syntrophales bacterium]|nr:HU family DNA-binding protein [Syntrophales bacterium]